MLERRSFLRGLVSLPLIGGSVTLLGHPTAAAVPVSRDLMGRYIAFLHHEAAAAKVEAWPIWREAGVLETDFETCKRAHMGPYWERHQDIDALVRLSPASARAAVILSAAGIPIGGAA